MEDEGEQNVGPGKDGTSSPKKYTKRDLFQNTMKGDWNAVLEIYRKHPEFHMLQITSPGDTALHIAISEDLEQKVEELIKLIINQGNGKAALKIQNKRGSTPLHFAAALGNLKMCKHLVEADSSLVGVSDSKGETPYFMAAANGKKEVFLYLHSICGTSRGYAWRLSGDSVLHLTIAHYHFDLAFQIIHLYGKMLVDSSNQEGMLPLHELASKPFAFRSSCQMGLLKTSLYNCIFVDKLNVEAPYQQSNNEKNRNSHKSSNCPKIYTKCMEFFQFLDNLLETVICFKCKKKPDAENPEGARDQGSKIPRLNLGFIKRAFEVLGLGPTTFGKIRDEKKKHRWALQVMDELLKRTSTYEDEVATGTFHPQDADLAEDNKQPYQVEDDQVKSSSDDISHDLPQTKHGVGEAGLPHTNRRNDQHGVGGGKKLHGETPLLFAAKHGIIEIVNEILDRFPIAKYDRNKDMKNIILMVPKNRHQHIYQLLQQNDLWEENLFQNLDNDGNSALHLAAKLGDKKPWDVARAMLQMQYEYEWYEFVRDSMPPQFYHLENNEGETPKDVLRKTHKDLVKDGAMWLAKTSDSCSVIAALIATVAFASSSTVPGGVQEKSGTPTLENQPAFRVFAMSSAVALYFSIIALLLFLGISASQYEAKDFGKQLTRRLLIGLMSLFISIASVLTSFCAGDFLALKGKLGYTVYPMLAATFLCCGRTLGYTVYPMLAATFLCCGRTLALLRSYVG